MTRQKIRKAIIPAAGLGTRFLPATKAQPKEMLPIVDTPAIQFIVEEAIASGIEELYGSKGKVTKVDGLSVEFADWRFNLRMSNTEPVIRLNVETRHDEKLMKEKTDELLAVIRG